MMHRMHQSTDSMLLDPHRMAWRQLPCEPAWQAVLLPRQQWFQVRFVTIPAMRPHEGVAGANTSLVRVVCCEQAPIAGYPVISSLADRMLVGGMWCQLPTSHQCCDPPMVLDGVGALRGQCEPLLPPWYEQRDQQQTTQAQRSPPLPPTGQQVRLPNPSLGCGRPGLAQVAQFPH